MNTPQATNVAKSRTESVGKEPNPRVHKPAGQDFPGRRACAIVSLPTSCHPWQLLPHHHHHPSNGQARGRRPSNNMKCKHKQKQKIERNYVNSYGTILGSRKPSARLLMVDEKHTHARIMQPRQPQTFSTHTHRGGGATQREVRRHRVHVWRGDHCVSVAVKGRHLVHFGRSHGFVGSSACLVVFIISTTGLFESVRLPRDTSK